MTLKLGILFLFSLWINIHFVTKSFSQRPYHVESTQSRQILEVTQRRARSVGESRVRRTGGQDGPFVIARLERHLFITCRARNNGHLVASFGAKSES